MASPREPSAPETISCDVCLTEVPASEAQIAEAVDYIVHFCGLECYAQWKKKAAGAVAPEAGDPEG